MAFAFDTLGYAKRLRDAGIPPEHAEVHAEAARDFVMAELVTRYDLQAIRGDLDTTRRELEGAIDRLSLRITVRMGVMIAAAVAVLAAIVQLGA